MVAMTGYQEYHIRGRFGAFGLLWAGLLLLAGCGSEGGSGGSGIDPGVVEVPIAYIKRPIPVDDDGDRRLPSHWRDALRRRRCQGGG